MNLPSKKTLSIAAATVALSTLTLVTSESAQAFIITNTTGTTPPAVINGLTTTSVIDFNSFPNNPPTAVPTPPTIIAATNTGTNGNARISKTDGVATYQGNELKIGDNGNDNSDRGTVSFTFDAPRGLGYFGLNWQNPAANESIAFYLGNTLIQSFTGLNLPSGGGNYFNFFVTSDNEIFNRVDLTRTPARGNAFRVDNVAYQVIPTPALLPSLVAVGLGVLRKRKVEAKAEA